MKYRKIQDGFDLHFSFDLDLNIFHNENFDDKGRFKQIIRLGFLGGLAYILSIIPSGI